MLKKLRLDSKYNAGCSISLMIRLVTLQDHVASTDTGNAYSLGSAMVVKLCQTWPDSLLRRHAELQCFVAGGTTSEPSYKNSRIKLKQTLNVSSET